jgi:hypothetical protein
MLAAVEAPAFTEDAQKEDSKLTPFWSTPVASSRTWDFGIARQMPVPAVTTAAEFIARFKSKLEAGASLDEWPTSTTEPVGSLWM